MDMPNAAPSISAGAIAYTEERRKRQERYQEAVKRAGFLIEREKENWALLAYMLTDSQLTEAEQIIINKDLRRLRMKNSLEKIKPLKERKNG